MNFVTIDFETADYPKESACAVGLVKFVEGKISDTYYSLIRPPNLYIRPDFTKIHGLSVEDVKDAPSFADIWEDIEKFIGSFHMAAHNAAFDMGVLKATLEWYDLAIRRQRYFCTCRLARNTWPDLPSFSLPNLAKHFNIIYNAHNALDDAITCGKLVLMSAKKYGSMNVKELLKGSGIKMHALR